MTDNKEKLVDKIQKLLAKANGTENEAEAMAFTEKAHALLAEHNLSMSDVRTAGSRRDDAFVLDRDFVTDSLPWRREMAAQVAAMFFCLYFYEYDYKSRPGSKSNGYKRSDKHTFVGARHNVDVAKQMFAYLNDTVERLANEGAKKQPPHKRSSYKTSFRAACASRISYRIWVKIQEARAGRTKSSNTGTTLPALADLYDQIHNKLKSFIEEEVGKLGKSRAAPGLTNDAGIRDGRAAGDRVGLDTQVTGKSEQKRLSA